MIVNILLVANLIVALLLALVIGYMWSLMSSLSVVTAHMAMFLDKKYKDFGDNQFEEMEE